MSPRSPRHVDSAVEVGRRLRTTREQRGLTQRDLSFEGCTSAYVSRIEAGARVPSLQVLREFAQRLAVTVDYLATGAQKRQEDVPDALTEATLAAGLGDVERAESLFEEVLTLETDARSRARASAGLGEIALRKGEHRAAATLLQKALESDELLPDEAALVADRLGRAFSMLGETESAIGIYEEWLERARTDDDALATLRFSMLLANVMVDSGNLARAEELLGKALSLAEQVRDPLDVARLWWSQSRLHTHREQPELADRYARRAITLLESTEHTGFAAAAYQLLAHAANDRGDGGEALRLLEQGYPTVVASGNRHHEATFRLERARALLLVGERAEAAAVAMGTIPVFADSSPNDAGRSYAVLADVFKDLGDHSRAIELYELAAEMLPSADRYLVAVCIALGELLEAEGRQDEAIAVFKRGLQMRETSRNSS